MKIGIVGVGQVGTATAFQLVVSGLADEIILSDINDQLAASQALDLHQASGAMPTVTSVRSGSYEDLASTDIIVITASAPLPPGKDRAYLLDSSSQIVDAIVPRIRAAGFNGIYVVVTNPCDVIAERVWRLSGLEPHQVMGTGTVVDSLRLRVELSKIFNVHQNSIQAFAMGEHGPAQFVPWSHVTFWGKPIADIMTDNPDRSSGVQLEDVLERAKASAWEIVKGKNTTSFGIAATTCEILRAIIRNEHVILPVSAYLNGEYGHSDLFMGVPAVISRRGIQEIVSLHLDEGEKASLEASVSSIQHLRSAAPALPE